MQLNLKTFTKEILDKEFHKNQRQCAIALNVTPECLNKIIKKKNNAGLMFIGKLKSYCDRQNLNFDYFIIPNK